jgi:hypothetical protein
MTRPARSFTRCATALAVACFAAGCGSGTDSTAGPSPTATSTTASTAPHTTAHATKVGACKRLVQSEARLSAAVKSKLDTLCEQASSETPAQLRANAEQVCEMEVNTSALPAGISKTRALATCAGR